MANVTRGQHVRMDFWMFLDDGTLIASSEERGPVEFAAGEAGEIFEVLSEAVVGKEFGERHRLEIQPDDAFGQVDPELIRRVDRQNVPREIQVGDQLQASDAEDGELPWTVVEVQEEFVVIDGNHPLAGQSLIVEVELAQK